MDSKYARVMWKAVVIGTISNDKKTTKRQKIYKFQLESDLVAISAGELMLQ